MVWACTPKPTAIRPAAKAVCCRNFFIDLSPTWVKKMMIKQPLGRLMKVNTPEPFAEKRLSCFQRQKMNYVATSMV
jgi:hypothetical protein